MKAVRRETARRRWRALSMAAVASAVMLQALPVRAAPSHHATAHAQTSSRAVAHPATRAASSSAGGWSAAGCGREPVAPTVATGTIASYNASIDAVTAYDQSARAYNACVSRTATTEQGAISADAKRRIDAIQSVSETVQKRIAANFVALGAALKKGPPAH